MMRHEMPLVNGVCVCLSEYDVSKDSTGGDESALDEATQNFTDREHKKIRVSKRFFKI